MNDWAIVFFYVDDLAYAFRKDDEAHVQELWTKMNQQFEYRNFGELHWFLSLRVTRDRITQRIWLDRTSYIEQMTRRYNFGDHSHPPITPGIDIFVPNEGIASSKDIHEYQNKIDSVLYTIIHTHPDMAKIVSRLAQFMANPSKAHLAAANHCIQYLDGSRDRCLLFDSHYEGDILEVFTDASFVDHRPDRRSF